MSIDPLPRWQSWRTERSGMPARSISNAAACCGLPKHREHRHGRVPGRQAQRRLGTPVMPSAASALCSVLRNNLGRRHQVRSAVLAPPCSWARRRPENGHGHKRLLIPGLNAAAPCAVPPPHKLAAAAPLQLPRDPHPQIALDRHTVRPVEVGRVVGSGKETDVLRHRRDDAAANLKRGRAEGGRKHD